MKKITKEEPKEEECNKDCKACGTASDCKEADNKEDEFRGESKDEKIKRLGKALLDLRMEIGKIEKALDDKKIQYEDTIRDLALTAAGVKQ